ncbi:glycine cleavage system H protein [Capsulimonas corticalis]|uniref:Glycine cleavage system H protein n=1 Tax=Capsulimonas corticalis TaxID=2219043 RepID=A0A402CX54_9BACT|nr:glycine cleavage system protein GcvH [Capsulimonas corticalis]BDI32392.1 glycine cleavage system H protein [Capsulimonas corticalis]
MSMPQELKYTKSHEWVSVDGDIVTVGITDHAQEELGDVAMVLFPEVGRVLQVEEKFGEIESIKAVSDLYAPVSGTVIAVNDALMNAPELVNDDAYGEGWMVRISMTNLGELDSLLTADQYAEIE